MRKQKASRMSVEIDLPPETQADLAAQATALGMPLAVYLRRLLEEHAKPEAVSRLSSEQRARLWRESAGGLDGTPLLSDEAISRDAIYAHRG